MHDAEVMITGARLLACWREYVTNGGDGPAPTSKHVGESAGDSMCDMENNEPRPKHSRNSTE